MDIEESDIEESDIEDSDIEEDDSTKRLKMMLDFFKFVIVVIAILFFMVTFPLESQEMLGWLGVIVVIFIFSMIFQH